MSAKTTFLLNYPLVYEEVPFKLINPVNNRAVAQLVRKFGIK